ncbi:NAD(P)-dependent alcohol dehydrogenase [Roseicyclus persicicus]|uniref:NAD(P)-dependent alcohol dehydrogenase n=1 Tax=Roseicyclus persicicus TaxID=2650661 RepID=A0A7X6GXV9_9RHOB|nr:NAD(P)-dependent alcohol dehydrogenase [Roseibacterium persicicum]NKX43147.1 NAD(P)-dependent alcohol dehydrogenase [Roseibacterium persicicum]
MKAAINTRYGGPEVVSLAEIPRPRPGKGEVLVRVAAAGVTTADWRLRAAAFPGAIMATVGRLMFGLFRPRNPVLGSDYAGTVVEVGKGVTDFAPGDRVYGFSGGGAHAEYLVAKAGGAIAPLPAGLSDAEAAALPFGGQTALEFLGRFAAVKPGERVLVLGASGGVGVYAVQVARALGAEVTGVASGGNLALVESLGAAHTVDYRKTDPAGLTGPYDVVFDTIGALDYARAAPMLAPGGRFVPLTYGLRDVWLGRKAKRNGHRQIVAVNGDSREGLDRLSDMVAAGQLRPVIDRVYPFEAIREAHAHVDSRRRKGAVIVTIEPGKAQLKVA